MNISCQFLYKEAMWEFAIALVNLLNMLPRLKRFDYEISML